MTPSTDRGDAYPPAPHHTSQDPWYSNPFTLARNQTPPGPQVKSEPVPRPGISASLRRSVTSPALPLGIPDPRSSTPDSTQISANHAPLSGRAIHLPSSKANRTVPVPPPAHSILHQREVRVYPKEEADPFWVRPYDRSRSGKVKIEPNQEAIQALSRRFEGKQANFLVKLYAILEQPEYHSILRWDVDGRTIVIERPADLATMILPLVFRQSKFASFSRQLNIYGFMRKVSLRNTDRHISDPDASTWSHEHLTRNSTREEIEGYKRRVPPRQSSGLPPKHLILSPFPLQQSQVPSPASSSYTSHPSPFRFYRPHHYHAPPTGIRSSHSFGSIGHMRTPYPLVPQIQRSITHPPNGSFSQPFAPRSLPARLLDRRSSAPSVETARPRSIAPVYTPGGSIQTHPTTISPEQIDPKHRFDRPDKVIASLLPQSAPAGSGSIYRNVIVQQSHFRTRSDQGEPLSGSLSTAQTPYFPSTYAAGENESPAPSELDPYHNPPFWLPGPSVGGGGDVTTPGSDASDTSLCSKYDSHQSSGGKPLQVQLSQNSFEPTYTSHVLSSSTSIPAPLVPNLSVPSFTFPTPASQTLPSANSVSSDLSSSPSSSSFLDTTSSTADLLLPTTNGTIDPSAMHVFPSATTSSTSSRTSGSGKVPNLFRHLSSPHEPIHDRRTAQSPSKRVPILRSVSDGVKMRSAPYPQVAQSMPGKALPRLGVPMPGGKRRSSLANVYSFAEDLNHVV